MRVPKLLHSNKEKPNFYSSFNYDVAQNNIDKMKFLHIKFKIISVNL